MAFAGFLPDLDYILRFFVPTFSHGVWTHTIVVSYLMATLWAICAWVALRTALRGTEKAGRMLLHFIGLAIIAVSSHLALDAWTFYETAEDQVHHMFFWPFWNFPVHINTMFPAATYDLRVAVEVVYSIFVGVVILFVQWAWKKQNPLRMFVPANWVITTNEIITERSPRKAPWNIVGFAIGCYSILGFYLIISIV